MTQSGSLHRSLLRAVEDHPTRIAVSDKRGQRTYAELATEIAAVVEALQAQRLQAGEPVLILLPNGIEFVVAHFAILSAGGLSVPCDPQMADENFSHIARQTEARILITAGTLLDQRRDLVALNALTTLWFGSPGEQGDGEPLQPRIDDGTADLAARISPRGGDDLSSLLFTTGSIGRPKGVMLAHENTLFTVGNLISRLGYSADDCELITLPLTHSFGLGHVYCNLFSGGRVHLLAGMASLKQVFRGLRELTPTGFPGTPLGFALLMDRAGEAFAEAAAGLRFIMVNSAPLPRERALQLQQMLPATELFVYYGLTEASRSTLISLSRTTPERLTSVGKPFPGAEIAIEPEQGEILIRGPHLAKGYWRDPERTAEVFADGWLRSGDFGRLDEDGNLFVLGRLKEQINIGGFKVDPVEVEKLLAGFPEIEDAGVCLLPDEGAEDGLLTCAYVPAGNATLDAKAIERACSDRIEFYKIPRHWIAVAAIPRSETGKIRRNALSDLVHECAGRDGPS